MHKRNMHEQVKVGSGEGREESYTIANAFHFGKSVCSGPTGPNLIESGVVRVWTARGEMRAHNLVA